MTRQANGAALLARGLAAHGVQTVFAVPGSQSVPLLEAMHREGLRIVSGTSELTTTFMAVGHAALTRRPAVLATIPGPGFTYALSGIAEARLDSLPLVWLALAPEEAGDGRPTLQAIPQLEMAAPLVKDVVQVGRADEVSTGLAEAMRQADFGEPGPLLLHLSPSALRDRATTEDDGAGKGDRRPVARGEIPLRADPPASDAFESAVDALLAARRPLLLVGQGGLDAPAAVGELAGRLRAPVVTTTSARGVMSEADGLVMVVDRPGQGAEALNDLLAEADLVVGLGCGLSHNGSHGFSLELSRERFLRVDASPHAFRPPYRARIELCSDVRTFLERALMGIPPSESTSPGWEPDELVRWKARLEETEGSAPMEPVAGGVPNGSMEELFQALAAALPDDAVVVTDSGRHQMLARRHLRIRSPGGLLVPADFQSMGFGIPTALGAKLAAPEREVVAIVGDGGFQITMAELLVARREKLAIRIVVFTDGEFALIADHQRREYGRATATDLLEADLEPLARSLNVTYRRLGEGTTAVQAFQDMVTDSGPSLVEVPLGRSTASRRQQVKARTREVVRGAIGETGASWIRKALGGGS